MTFVRSLFGSVGRIKSTALSHKVGFTQPIQTLLPTDLYRRWQTTSSAVDYDNADPEDVVSEEYICIKKKIKRRMSIIGIYIIFSITISNNLLIKITTYFIHLFYLFIFLFIHIFIIFSHV